MMTLELPRDEVIKLLMTQRQLIDHQQAQIANLSRRPSEASAPMRVDRDGIDQLADHCKTLTLDALQETEKMVKYRGKFLRESEFNAIEKADAEEPFRPVAKGWYISEIADVYFKKRRYVKGISEYTCEECDGWWVKTGSAPTTLGSTEIASPSGSTEMLDADAGTAPPAEPAGTWEKVSALPKGVLQEWQLRSMCIPVVCTYPHFECGICGAKWVEVERITAVGM